MIVAQVRGFQYVALTNKVTSCWVLYALETILTMDRLEMSLCLVCYSEAQ